MRYLLPDLLRTLAITMMVIYHIAFDLSYFWTFKIDVLNGGWWLFARTTATLFLFVVGMSFWIGNTRKRSIHRYLFRLGQIGGSALLISIVTWFIAPDVYIRFGILHLIAISLLFLPLFQRLPSLLIGMCGVAVIVVGLIFGNLTTTYAWLLMIGITRPDFATLDYYPLFPWMGWVLLGFALAPKLIQWFPHTYNPLTAHHWPLLPGRHALIIYLLHQPILIAILAIFLGMPSF